MKKPGRKMAILGLLLIILASNRVSAKDQDMLLPVRATYVDGRTFTVPGDYTAKLAVNARVRADLGAGVLKGSYIASSSWARGVTIVHLRDTILTNPISGIWVAALSEGLSPDGNGEVNALDYAGGTPSMAGLQAALRAIGGSNRTLRLPSGTWPLNEDLTLPANITLKLERGVMLTIAAGKTLTINSGVDAGLYQFITCTGTGKVVFGSGTVKEVYPEWWGAYSDGTHAAATYAAIQAAIDSGYNPVSLPAANGNYAIGTRQLLITNAGSQHLKMAVGSRITYSGTDAAIKVYVGGGTGSIYGLILDLFDIFSQTAAYGIKVVGDGVTDGGKAGIARAKIRAHQIFGFSIAGFFTNTCLFCENEISIDNMQCVYPGDPINNYVTAKGYIFDNTNQVALNFVQESNKIKTFTVNARTALYAPGNFTENIVEVGLDHGSIAPDNTYEMFHIGGQTNLMICTITNPVQAVNTLYLLPKAIGNTIIASPHFFAGLTDESPAGSNNFVTPKDNINLLKNPSFEWWAFPNSPIYWAPINHKASRITNDVRHGNVSVKVTSTGASGNFVQTLPNSVIGQTATFSGWFKASSANTKIPAFYLQGSAGANGLPIPNDDKWHFLAINYSFPAGSTTPQAVIYADGGAGVAGQEVLCDGLVVVLGTLPTMPENDQDHKNLLGLVTWDPARVADGAMTSTTVGCIGAAAGDPVSVGFSIGVPAGVILSGSVTAADTVTVTLVNKTGAPKDFPAGTLKVVVRKTEH